MKSPLKVQAMECVKSEEKKSGFNLMMERNEIGIYINGEKNAARERETR